MCPHTHLGFKVYLLFRNLVCLFDVGVNYKRERETDGLFTYF